MYLQFNGRTAMRIATLATAVLGAGGAMAQQSPDRTGRWETRLGLVYNGSWDSGFRGGSEARVGSELGFSFGVGYNSTSRLSFGGTFEFDRPGYNATLVSEADPSQTYRIRGRLDNMRFLGDVTYNFTDEGPFSPYVSALAGWTWTDTNIATSPPQTGCWWDPWWGPICMQWQNTRTIDGFSYGLGGGVRYDFNHAFALQAAYRYVWTDYSRAAGTPSQDGFTLGFNWKF